MTNLLMGLLGEQCFEQLGPDLFVIPMKFCAEKK